MKRAIYPGSFDPVTYGHLDIIKRSAEIFDELTVSILDNKMKTPLFSVEERVKMLKEATKEYPNVKVDSFSGLLVDYTRKNNIGVSIRGLRAITDFEYELQLSQTNHVIAPEIDTIFLTTNLKYSYLSSSIVKEIAEYHGDIRAFVHPEIANKIEEKLVLRERMN